MFKKHPLNFLLFTIKKGKTPGDYAKDMLKEGEKGLEQNLINRFISETKDILGSRSPKSQRSKKSLKFSKIDPFTNQKISSHSLKSFGSTNSLLSKKGSNISIASSKRKMSNDQLEKVIESINNIDI
jgi:hypothetical protein